MSRELKAFLIDTLYRCAWTFCEAIGAVIIVGQTITDIDWSHSLSVAAVATLACLVKQIGKYAKEHFAAQGQDDEIEYIGDIYDEDYEEDDTEYEDIEEGDAE